MSIEHKELPDEISMHKSKIEIEIFKSKLKQKKYNNSLPQATLLHQIVDLRLYELVASSLQYPTQ